MPKKPLSETVKEHWSDKLELGGCKSSYVSCYAANQVLGSIWRGNKEDADAQEIRERATLRRLSDIVARDVIEAMPGAWPEVPRQAGALLRGPDRCAPPRGAGPRAKTRIEPIKVSPSSQLSNVANVSMIASMGI